MKKVFLCLIAIMLLFVSCSKNESQVEAVAEVAVEETAEAVVEENVNTFKGYVPPEKERAISQALQNVAPLEVSGTAVSASFHTDAHQKYLDDELKFSTELDESGQDYVYLVRNDACMFYPLDDFIIEGERCTIKDVNNMHGESLPLGTILPRTEKERRYRSGGPEWYETTYGYFYLNKNYNWMYKTTWNGQEGFVFGSYIETLNQLTAEIYALFYKTNGVFDTFYPLEGTNLLNDKTRNALEEDKLVIVKTNKNYPSVDDLIDIYSVPDQTSMFVTTDLASHVQHRIFDNQLARIEEEYFIPRLIETTGMFIEKLSERDDLPEIVQHRAIAYFQLPELILRAAPYKVVDKDAWREPEKYVTPDINELLPEYPEDVQGDYANVEAAQSGSTAIFGTGEDFTQYKPRGHYTKNGALEAYFKAMMWFGRIHFTIAQEGNAISDAETAIMEPVAMAIVDTVHKNPELYDAWVALFDPITELIGMSDDLGFSDVLPLWKEQDVEDFNAWVTDTEALNAFVNLCHEKLRPPAISGNSSFYGPAEYDDEGKLRPPMGWRFLGQRFTWDSYIHQAVTAPRLYIRDYPSGLDVMKVFGSKTADTLLTIREGGELMTVLDKLQDEFAEKDDSFWKETYYNNVLAQIRAQTTFEQGAGFYFTESPLWGIKAMISSNSTWAELRHDTILYVKQVYGERAGDGDLNPTYDYLALPKPINYIEPNLPFWECSLTSVQILYNCLAEYDLLDEESQSIFSSLIDIYTHAIDIVKLEAEDEPVSEADNKWIRTMPSLFKSLLILKTGGYMDEDAKKMACIADVYTNAEQGMVLEVGVGKPYKLYIPLNDGQGGKRIAIGYMPSYYEFNHSQDDRMTDEQWKQIVYQDHVDMTDYEPFWEQGCYLQ